MALEGHTPEVLPQWSTQIDALEKAKHSRTVAGLMRDWEEAIFKERPQTTFARVMARLTPEKGDITTYKKGKHNLQTYYSLGFQIKILEYLTAHTEYVPQKLKYWGNTESYRNSLAAELERLRKLSSNNMA